MNTIPMGRLDELRARPDADRIAYSIMSGVFSPLRWKVYASRHAMLQFCKQGSMHHALIKDCVHPNMLVNRNTQREMTQYEKDIFDRTFAKDSMP